MLSRQTGTKGTQKPNTLLSFVPLCGLQMLPKHLDTIKTTKGRTGRTYNKGFGKIRADLLPMNCGNSIEP